MYVLGSDECNMGIHIVDISDPSSPEFVMCYDTTRYSHDMHCVDYHGPDTAYTGHEICVVFTGSDIQIIDFTLKCAVQMIATDVIYGELAYSHQGWFSDDHSYFVMGDEEDEITKGVNTRTLFWDATSLSNPVLMYDYRAATTSVDHNQYIHNGYIWQSNYCSGLHVLSADITSSVQEVGFFDLSQDCTFLTGSYYPWLGSWSNYPFFNSGNIAVSSIETGLFILKVSMPPPPLLVQICKYDICIDDSFDCMFLLYQCYPSILLLLFSSSF
jgi:choice-of-anchor B domain-containing protein